MNEFTKASQIERAKMEKLFEKFNVSIYSFTKDDSYDQHDGVFINSKDENIMFEVKVRNVTSTQYKTTVIEKSKYDYLMSQTDKVPYLFIFFSDGTYFPHRLDKNNDYKQSAMGAPKTTAGDQTRITKQFIEIPINPKQIYKQ